MARGCCASTWFSYDSAGRLIGADDRRLSDDRCVRRSYTYDGKSNRTGRDIVAAAPGAACATGAPASRSWTYDNADRTTNAGWAYDAFGRATAVPAPDSGGRGALTAAYYADDRVRQLSLDGRTHTYERDPLGRTASVFSTGGPMLAVTSSNRYADDTDTPVARTRSDGTTVRDITGPSGQLVATKAGATLTYQLRDVHGRIVATAPVGGSPTARTDYDEFGRIASPTPNVLDWSTGTPGYGWLGAHQRSTEFEQFEGAGPPMEMGVRVYLPAVGRFLQEDPVDGGSANAYDYALQDPVNLQDLDGRCVLGAPCPEIVKKTVRKAGKAGEKLIKTGRGAYNAGKNLVRAVTSRAPIGWGACFGWKMGKATNGRTPSAKEVAKISAQCTGAGFLFE